MDKKISTQDRIIQEALALFAMRGYGAVSVQEIAEKVGIKAPSLYKHFSSKQEIFDAITKEMSIRYAEKTKTLDITGVAPDQDADVYAGVFENELVEIGLSLFDFFLSDEMLVQYRKMLTIEQFNDPALATVFSTQYVDTPLEFQKSIFTLLLERKIFMDADPKLMALQFYAPFYLLLGLHDREEKRHAEIIELLEKHIRQFSQIYLRTEK